MLGAAGPRRNFEAGLAQIAVLRFVEAEGEVLHQAHRVATRAGCLQDVALVALDFQLGVRGVPHLFQSDAGVDPKIGRLPLTEVTEVDLSTLLVVFMLAALFAGSVVVVDGIHRELLFNRPTFWNYFLMPDSASADNIGSTAWNIFSCVAGSAMQMTMKIVGIGALYPLVTGDHAELAGSAAALHAELAAAEWADVEAIRQAYPHANVVGHLIEIALPAKHCAVIAVNYVAGVASIEFAGLHDDAPRARRVKRRKDP